MKIGCLDTAVVVKDPLGGFTQGLGSDLLFSCMTKNFPDVYTCRKCNFRAYLYVNLKTHIEMIHKLKENTPLNKISEICDKHYNLAKILQAHKCDKCAFSTFSVLVMLRHSHTHEPKKNSEAHLQLYKCELCPFKNSIKLQLSYHIDKKHSEFNWFACHRCLYKTIFPANLAKHKLEIHNTPVYQCEFCYYKCPVKSQIKSHVLNRHTKHEDIKWFRCERCQFKGKTKSELNRHQRQVHLDSSLVKWLVCELCEFKTKKLSNLKQHVLHVHLKEQREVFLCEVCAYQSTSKWYLMQHIEKKHGT